MLAIELPWMMSVVGLMVVFGILALIGLGKEKKRNNDKPQRNGNASR